MTGVASPVCLQASALCLRSSEPSCLKVTVRSLPHTSDSWIPRVTGWRFSPQFSKEFSQRQGRTLGENGCGGALFPTPPCSLNHGLSEQWDAEEFKMNSRQPFFGTSVPTLLNPPFFLLRAQAFAPGPMFMVANMSIIERISDIFSSLFCLKKKKDFISKFNRLGEYEKPASQVFYQWRFMFSQSLKESLKEELFALWNKMIPFTLKVSHCEVQCQGKSQWVHYKCSPQWDRISTWQREEAEWSWAEAWAVSSL